MPAFDLYNKEAAAEREAEKERQRRNDALFSQTSAAKAPPPAGTLGPVPPYNAGLSNAGQRYTAPTPGQQRRDSDVLATASRKAREADPNYLPTLEDDRAAGRLPGQSNYVKPQAPAPRATGLRRLVNDEIDALKALPGQLKAGARDLVRRPVETAARALAPLAPSAGAFGVAANGLRQASAVANGARLAKANPFKANTVRAVVNSNAIQAGARIVGEAPGRLARFGAGLRDSLLPLAGIGAAAAALPHVERSNAQGRAYAANAPVPGSPEARAAAQTAAAQTAAAQTAAAPKSGTAGESDSQVAFQDPPSEYAMRTMRTGRDAKGNLVATNSGSERAEDLGARTGLRERSFAPETKADRDRAAAASEQYYKNIGGGMDAQLARNSQVLADEAGGARAAAASNGGGLRRGSSSEDGSPSFRDQIELAKLTRGATEFDITREDTKNENAADAAAAEKTEARTYIKDRSNQYFDQLGEDRQQEPTARADSDLLAQFDFLKDSNADLLDAENPATRTVRENLAQRATELVNSKHTRWTTIDPSAAPIPMNNANLSAISTGKYRGGAWAFLPDAIDDLGGSIVITKSDGKQVMANADEFDPVTLQILRRAADLGAKDRAYIEEASNGLRK